MSLDVFKRQITAAETDAELAEVAKAGYLLPTEDDKTEARKLIKQRMGVLKAKQAVRA